MALSYVEMSNLEPKEEEEPTVSTLHHHQIPTSRPIEENSPGTSPHPLQFITLTESPSSQKNDFSYTVRSHAMQSFLREKKIAQVDHLKPEPARVKEHDQQNPKQLSGKFKLATWSRKARSRKKRTSTSRENSAETVSTKVEDDHGEDFSIPIESYESALLSPLLDTHILDILYHCICPIPLCPLCQVPFEEVETPTSSNMTWEASTASDLALVHATLSLAAQSQDLLRGDHESAETLFHKGEAIRLMNRRLVNGSHAISDADIMAVATFVILESLNGTFEAASAHRIGLLKMIKVQGSIMNCGDNNIVDRVLSWSDILFSTRFGSPPNFSHILDTNLPSLDIVSSSEHLYSPIFRDQTTSSILHLLRYISSTIDDPKLSPMDKSALTNLIYHTQYTLLTTHPISTLQHHPSTTSSQRSPSNHQINSPREHLKTAFHISCLLYIQTQLYALPSSKYPHSRLLSHLLGVVTDLSTLFHQSINPNPNQKPKIEDRSLIHPSLCPKDPSQQSTTTLTHTSLPTLTNEEITILLWILVTAILTNPPSSTKVSFMTILRDLYISTQTLQDTKDPDSDSDLDLDPTSVLRERIKSVVWMENERWEDALWGVLEEMGYGR